MADVLDWDTSVSLGYICVIMRHRVQTYDFVCARLLKDRQVIYVIRSSRPKKSLTKENRKITVLLSDLQLGKEGSSICLDRGKFIRQNYSCSSYF